MGSRRPNLGISAEGMEDNPNMAAIISNAAPQRHRNEVSFDISGLYFKGILNRYFKILKKAIRSNQNDRVRGGSNGNHTNDQKENRIRSIPYRADYDFI